MRICTSIEYLIVPGAVMIIMETSKRTAGNIFIKSQAYRFPLWLQEARCSLLLLTLRRSVIPIIILPLVAHALSAVTRAKLHVSC